MSEICDNEEDAEQTVKWYQENEKRYDTPAIDTLKFGYVVFNESIEIFKNIKYQKVDLTVMLNGKKKIKLNNF